MHNENYVLTSLVMTLLRAIERHRLGSKIPDLIIDRFITELNHVSESTLNALLSSASNSDSSIGQSAYNLWKMGELNVLALVREIERTSQSNPEISSELNHSPAAGLLAIGSFDFAQVAY
jgi:hypothetical protein